MRGLAVLMLLAGAAMPALAQTEPGDPAAGLRLASAWCANCHRVAPAGPGPASDGAPAFAAVAQMPSTTSMALPAVMLRHISHWLHGSAVGAWRQFRALANTRARVVLPTPRVPLKR